MIIRLRSASRWLSKFYQLQFALLLLFSCVLFSACAVPGSLATGQDGVQEGTFAVEITMEGGTGKAHIESPVMVTKDAQGMRACLVWSSENYDYMIVDGVRYENENPGGPSTFTIPVATLDEPLDVVADTVAMSKPHEIAYTIVWKTDADGSADAAAGNKPADAADAADFGVPIPSATACDLSFLGDGEEEITDLKYATQFTVKKHGEYVGINIAGKDYLLVPKGEEVPSGVPDSFTVLQKPLDKTYLVTSSGMDLICKCDALSNIRLSALDEKDWSVQEAADAMHAGKILYAGRYKAPDYELILQEGCNLAIENTMIYHNPEVMEKLQELGIPVIVETSSYEGHPLGRLEWVKLYGALFDKEAEADAWFEAQLKAIGPLMEMPDTGKTVAFFYVTTNGMINVRKSGDYISKMIRLSGGHYILADETGDEEGENHLSAMNMQMEDFYAAAKDADILIYNSTIEGEITSAAELIAKNELFADFKAVKEGQVYCLERDLFQQTGKTADFMQDLQAVLSDSGGELHYLTRLETYE